MALWDDIVKTVNSWVDPYAGIAKLKPGTQAIADKYYAANPTSPLTAAAQKSYNALPVSQKKNYSNPGVVASRPTSWTPVTTPTVYRPSVLTPSTPYNPATGQAGSAMQGSMGGQTAAAQQSAFTPTNSQPTSMSSTAASAFRGWEMEQLLEKSKMPVYGEKSGAVKGNAIWGDPEKGIEAGDYGKELQRVLANLGVSKDEYNKNTGKAWENRSAIMSAMSRWQLGQMDADKAKADAARQGFMQQYPNTIDTNTSPGMPVVKPMGGKPFNILDLFGLQGGVQGAVGVNLGLKTPIPNGQQAEPTATTDLNSPTAQINPGSTQRGGRPNYGPGSYAEVDANLYPTVMVDTTDINGKPIKMRTNVTKVEPSTVYTAAFFDNFGLTTNKDGTVIVVPDNKKTGEFVAGYLEKKELNLGVLLGSKGNDYIKQVIFAGPLYGKIAKEDGVFDAFYTDALHEKVFIDIVNQAVENKYDMNKIIISDKKLDSIKDHDIKVMLDYDGWVAPADKELFISTLKKYNTTYNEDELFNIPLMARENLMKQLGQIDWNDPNFANGVTLDTLIHEYNNKGDVVLNGKWTVNEVFSPKKDKEDKATARQEAIDIYWSQTEIDNRQRQREEGWAANTEYQNRGYADWQKFFDAEKMPPEMDGHFQTEAMFNQLRREWETMGGGVDWATWLANYDFQTIWDNRRPSERGERPQVFAPRMKSVSY